MNKVRRKALTEIKEQLDSLREQLESIKDEEEEARDNIPKRPRPPARVWTAPSTVWRMLSATLRRPWNDGSC